MLIRCISYLLLALLLHCSPAAFAGLPVALNGQSLPSLAPVLERVTPAVVNIATETEVRAGRRLSLFNDPFFRRFFDIPLGVGKRKRTSLGSGVIIDARRGFLVTNNHVIKGADTITVTLKDGRNFAARVIGVDPDTDIALIRIDAKRLVALPSADSDRLRVGDFVVAIGSPFGLSQTVTSGIVSALGRSGLGIEGYEDFIQTDASINPGNSGGALINLRGELVGINAAILAPGGGNVGIGFAIPVNLVKDVIAQLADKGRVRRARLGAKTQDLTAPIAQALGLGQHRGALITRVIKGSAAEQAGLRRGDVISVFDGRKVASSAQLSNAVGLARPGGVVELRGYRDGKPFAAKITLTAPQTRTVDGARVNRHLKGAVIVELPGEGAEQRLEVESVQPGSPASSAGIRAGDRIVGVNRRRVKDLDELLARAGAADGALIINLRRDQTDMYLLIR